MTTSQTTLDPQKLIGDTVHNPGSVLPLREEDCRIPIPTPNFFLVGGAKCGSTMLASVLLSHPDCCHSAPKETNFFTLNFDEGWDWYRGTFAHYNGEPVIGEASVSYGAIPFRKNVAKQLYEYNPDAKIVYICRHPWNKLVSGWKMATSGPGFVGHSSAIKGFEAYVLHEEPRADLGPWHNPTLGWDLAAPSSDDVTRVWLDGIYYEGQIDNYLSVFPADQVKVMFLEDWKSDPDGEAAELCRFLGLDPNRLPDPDRTPVNRADERRKVASWYYWFANSDALRPLRHLFPKDFRHSLRRQLFQSPLISRKLVYPDFQISDSFREDLLNYLRAKSAPFLERNGKQPAFWDLENIS